MSITKIVITGGPCAGKTTGMNLLERAFCKLGYRVLFVSETATELINGGIAPWTCRSNVDFQLFLTEIQLKKEEVFLRAAESMPEEKILIVCDRGIMDNRAYMSEEEFRIILDTLHLDIPGICDRYDAVFHLVTAARGAEEFYTLSNNKARTESPEEARLLDDRLINAWSVHPRLCVIGNEEGFESKMRRLVSEIKALL